MKKTDLRKVLYSKPEMIDSREIENGRGPIGAKPNTIVAGLVVAVVYTAAVEFMVVVHAACFVKNSFKK